MIVSFLYDKEPGATRKVFEKIDLMNLPNPAVEVGEDVLKAKLHPFDFLYDDETDVVQNAPFNYFIYQGSNTSPPCEEYVIWIIPDKRFKVSTTI